MNDYERPARGWVCGHAESGRSCPLGPDARGRCPTIAECAPLKRGDRWQCTRPASRGGACPQGPGPHGECSRPLPPCQPVRSLRARRARLVTWCAAAAGAFALLGVSGPWWRTFSSPGGLTPAHAKLQDDCTACHGDGAKAALMWIATPRPTKQSAANACLKCHAELGPSALNPHGLEPARGPRADLVCAACHREHRGARWNLKAMPDADCQACHARRITSFALDHPEFERYPATRRQRIVFDHTGHLKHVKEEGGAAADSLLTSSKTGESLVCQACHLAEQSGRMLPVNGFAPTCTACHHHAKQIRTAAGEGIPFVRLPGIDVESLSKRGFAIGEWPREAQGPGWDGPITPFMRLLLSTDAETQQALETLDAAASRSVHLFDLYEAGRGELRAAQRVAWAVKDLVLELSTDKHEALQRRLASDALEPDQRRALLAALSGELPVDQPRADLQELSGNLAELQRRWLPTLADELARHRSGARVTAARAPLVPAPEPSPAPPAAAVNLDDLLGGDTPPPPPPPPPVDPRKEQELADAVTRASEAEGRYERIAGALGQSPRWSLRELDFSIRYRPVGHADPFLKAWLDLTARMDANIPAGQALFAQLADTKSGPGLCTRCHSVDLDAEGLRQVQWRGDRPELRKDALTRFEHAPHLRLAGVDCSRCHRPSDAPAGAFLASFVQASTPKTDPAAIAGHFQNVTRALCAECHHDRGAPTDCLSCHRYHARSARMWQPGSRSEPEVLR